jgi:DNA-binding response OmpR family regulator
VTQLQAQGIDIELVADPVEGLRLALAGNLDVILLDERMPRLTGREILIDLQGHGVRTPVVVVTGYGSIESAVEAIKLGATNYLTKPCRAAAVLDLVRGAAMGPAPRRPGGHASPGSVEQASILSILEELDLAFSAGSETSAAASQQVVETWLRAVRCLARRLPDRALGISEYLGAVNAFTLSVSSRQRPRRAVVMELRQSLTLAGPCKGQDIDERVSSLFSAFGRWRDASRSAVAAHLGVNLERLDRKLFDEFGLGLVQLRQHLAIRQAILLLAETNLQLKHIAYDVGYLHPSAFTRDFEHCIAVPPTVFRRWLSDEAAN